MATTAFPGAAAVIRGSAAELRAEMARYAEAGVDEFIVPDWNAGSSPARERFFDWFAAEVAAGFR